MNTLSPVVRLNKATFTPTIGAPFTILCDLSPQTFNARCAKWQRTTKRHTAQSLIAFIKARHEHCICVTQAQYDAVTRGNIVHATKAEYDAQQA